MNMGDVENWGNQQIGVAKQLDGTPWFDKKR